MTETIQTGTTGQIEGAMSAAVAIQETEQERDAFAERLLEDVGGTMRMYTLFIGERLGLYDALADAASLTSVELARRTGTHERYVREWLEHQTVNGILKVENPEDGPTERRFRMPAGHAEVLVERDSLNYLAPLGRMLVGVGRPIDQLLEAFRTGEGVPYSAYGADAREAQAAINRSMFLQELGSIWIPAMPDVDERLRTKPDARVADIGCGAGWSSIGFAKTYPNVTVDGFDLDEPSVDLARENARGMGMTDRVRFHACDAAEVDAEETYDLVTAFECVHDMSDPVSVLRTMRRLAGEDGTVLVADERVGERFTPEGNDVEWMMYGWSVLHCLPVGMADHPSTGTGTVMRPDTVRRYAAEAGFRAVEILPIDNLFFRFYRLRP